MKHDSLLLPFPTNPLAHATRRVIVLTALLSSGASLAQGTGNEVVELSALTVTAEAESGSIDPSQDYRGRANRHATGLPMTQRETPQTVSVMTQKRMRDQDLTTVSKALAQAPGLSVKEYDSARQYYFARGFEVTNLLIDGVPTLYDPGWGTGETDSSTAMYEQVELIKGATGLMTGSGNPSAAINLVRKRAVARELEGSVALGAGSRDRRSGSLDVASALNGAGNLRGRAVVSHEEQDSFRRIGNSSNSLVYLTSEADLGPDTLLTLGGSYQQNENRAPTWGGIPAWHDDGSRTRYSRSKTTAADWAYWDTDHQSLFAELSHFLNDDWQLQARFNTGEAEGESRLLYVTGTPNRETGQGIEPWAGGSFDTTARFRNLDLFALGQFSLLDRQHDATFGVSRSERKFSADSANALSVAPIGNFNAWTGRGYPEHIWGPDFLYEEQTDTQTAFYGSTRLHLTDRLTTILGARVTDLEIDREEAAYNAAEVIEHDRIVTPYVGLLYDFTDQLTGYASYTDIFTPQNERDRSGNPLDPIVGKSYELGIKAGFMNDRLVASAAVFRIEQDNLAIADGGNTVAGSADQAYREASGATSRGYEIELTGALRDGWDLQLGWTAYRLENDEGEKITTEQPRRIFKAFTTYQLPGALSRLTLGGGLGWESETYASVTNPVTGAPARIEQDDLTLVNLMARYQLTEQLTAQLNVDNLTDETYYTNIGTFGQIAYGAPRTLSVTAQYDF